MRAMTFRRLLPFACLLLPSAIALAQTPPQVDQSQLLNRPPAPTGPDETRSLGEFVGSGAPASPGDRDLGEQVILKRQTKATPWSFQAEASVNGTSNVALVNRGARSDIFFLGQMALAWQKKFGENLLAEATVSQGFFRYGELTEFDFDTLNAGLGATYQWKDGISFAARYNFNRLTTATFDREFFTQNSITIGAQKTFSINSAFFLYAGANARFNWNDPSVTTREEYSIYGGARAALTRSITVDAFLRGSYFDYVNFGRNDFNGALGLTARWSPRPWFALTASTSLGLNRSDLKVFDYKVANGGLSLGAVFRF